jgi:phospholipid transport system substrate-binding protein
MKPMLIFDIHSRGFLFQRSPRKRYFGCVTGRNEADMAIQRRALLTRLLAGAIMTPLAVRARAQVAGDAGPKVVAETMNAALLAAMKAGARTSVAQRFAIIAPAVDQAFDLQTVLKNSVGLHWSGLPDEEKARLLATFRRYTIMNYVANFDSWAGQSFRVGADPRVLSPTLIVVGNSLIRVSGSPVELSYVMQQTQAGWKVVDVLADGSISRVAVQRSDFRGLLANGGVAALVSSLERKVADLSGGTLV